MLESKYELTPHTILNNLDMPHLEIVLDEIFFLPSLALFSDTARPQTLEDLAQLSGMALPKVIDLMKGVLRQVHNIGMKPQDFTVLEACHDSSVKVLDVRPSSSSPSLFADVIRFHEFSFPELLPKLREASQLITLCEDGRRSFSAAMYLRSLGMTSCRYVEGGLSALQKT